jgi:hypothetical protein
MPAFDLEQPCHRYETHNRAIRFQKIVTPENDLNAYRETDPPFCASMSMAYSPCPTLENEQGRSLHDAATERWLKTIQQKMRAATIQPRVHFQRTPMRPVDEEGILRDFE